MVAPPTLRLPLRARSLLNLHPAAFYRTPHVCTCRRVQCSTIILGPVSWSSGGGRVPTLLGEELAPAVACCVMVWDGMVCTCHDATPLTTMFSCAWYLDVSLVYCTRTHQAYLQDLPDDQVGPMVCPAHHANSRRMPVAWYGTQSWCMWHGMRRASPSACTPAF